MGKKMNEIEVELSKCCNAALLADLDYNEIHYWSDVAEAPLVCEICGEKVSE